jgi:hypothetical protein
LRDELQCHALAVYHGGKTTLPGLGGHSVLTGDTDTEIEVIADRIVEPAGR